jgi:hypothetical protein
MDALLHYNTNNLLHYNTNKPTLTDKFLTESHPSKPSFSYDSSDQDLLIPGALPEVNEPGTWASRKI